MQATEAPPQETITPEQAAQRKKELETYFKEQIPFLTLQKEYQTLVTEIEELQARQVRAQVMIANALAPPPQDPEEQPQQERKLRKT